MAGRVAPAGTAAKVAEIKVSPWDGAGMKRTLDDNIAEAFAHVSQLPRDNRWFDFKLLLMFVACATALIAQFYPLPFPDSRLLLGVCVAVYFGISAFWQYLAWFVEKDYVCASRPETDATGKVVLPAVHIRTRMGKYDHEYTIIAECPVGKEVARTTFSVGRVFTEAGKFSLPHFEALLGASITPAIEALRGKKAH